ncbi:hypothetical protein CSA37_01060 [Candidatus Fermentibacteria bacterium]|nr:MAG: hypothetical protein CSA37_01060 [Candidatus Fermentibacteria bacterium]
MGDTVIFRSQFQALSSMGVQVGVLSAHPEETEKRYKGVKCFDVRKGRLRAVLAGLFWCDIAVVGGGELVQDQSSGLYTPFNLLPLFLAFFLRKKSFAWAVGIGQGKELGKFSRLLTKLAMKTTSGITVRDRGSFNTLYRLGCREPEMILVSDCALASDFPEEKKLNIIGAAPRNVSNRQRHLLPLEMRKKLGLYRETDPVPAAAAWAALLDGHVRKHSSDVVLFPFHTGSLSNNDRGFCRLVQEKMKMKERVTIAEPAYLEAFLKMLSRCPVLVTTPLHGSILAVSTGTVPVSVSYSSKCVRFMKQAGLDRFISCGKPGIPDNGTALLLEKAWQEFRGMQEQLQSTASNLACRADRTAEHFRKSLSL